MEVLAHEADAGQGECRTETGIEEGHEPAGHDAEAAQGNTAAHHDGHDDIALHVEEPQHVHLLLTVAVNARGMLGHELREHGVEGDERRGNTDNEKPQRGRAGRHGLDAHAHDLRPGDEPHRSRDEQQIL